MSKLRNRLLALACLVAFVALGFVYFRVWVVHRTFGIVLITGDGLTMDQLVAARLYAGGAEKPLGMERLENVALIRNFSEDCAVPDTAAAVSAIATGVRVRNYSSSVTPAGRPLDSLFQRARRAGRSTGLVTTGRLTDGGVAPFYASTDRLSDFQDISAQLAAGNLVDVMLGGGAADFQPEEKGGKRLDGRDLLLEFARNGYTLCRTRAELEAASGWPRPRVAGIFADGPLDYHENGDRSVTQPRLAEMVRRAIELLQNDRDGYLLVVHVGSIAAAAEANDAETAILESLEMDRAVTTASAYAGENSTVIACGLHAIGGMTLNGYPFVWQNGADLLGTNSFGIPSITWSTGPNAGTQAANTVESGTNASNAAPVTLSDMAPAAFPLPRAIHTVQDVIAVGRGAGSEKLRGFMRHTDIHTILREQL